MHGSGVILRWAMLAAAVAVAACGDTPAAEALPLGDDTIAALAPAAVGGDVFHGPLDSTPDAEAHNVYFTAQGKTGPGVFEAPLPSGAATELFTGAPFVAPIGIAIAPDDSTIFVADPEAMSTGVVFTLPSAGGSPSPIAATEGYAPRGLDVVEQAGEHVIYFTGHDPADGKPGVFKIVGGGMPVPVVRGDPLVEPDGVAVARDGTVYVSDRAAGGGTGRVFRVQNGKASTLVEKVRLGNPGGVALTLDESVLLVSGLQPDRDSDLILLVDVEAGDTGVVTSGISANKGAGGVHRARNAHDFTWVDLTAGTSGEGLVYSVGTKRTYKGGTCNCSFGSVDACMKAGGTSGFCSSCC